MMRVVMVMMKMSCLYVAFNKQTHTHMQTHTHTYRQTHTHTHTHTPHTHTHTHTRTHTNKQTHSQSEQHNNKAALRFTIPQRTAEAKVQRCTRASLSARMHT